jgi:hypothetical protein
LICFSFSPPPHQDTGVLCAKDRISFSRRRRISRHIVVSAVILISLSLPGDARYCLKSFVTRFVFCRYSAAMCVVSVFNRSLPANLCVRYSFMIFQGNARISSLYTQCLHLRTVGPQFFVLILPTFVFWEVGQEKNTIVEGNMP